MNQDEEKSSTILNSLRASHSHGKGLADLYVCEKLMYIEQKKRVTNTNSFNFCSIQKYNE